MDYVKMWDMYYWTLTHIFLLGSLLCVTVLSERLLRCLPQKRRKKGSIAFKDRGSCSGRGSILFLLLLRFIATTATHYATACVCEVIHLTNMTHFFSAPCRLVLENGCLRLLTMACPLMKTGSLLLSFPLYIVLTIHCCSKEACLIWSLMAC